VVKVINQKLSKHCAEVTQMAGMHLIFAVILYPFLMSQSFWKWDNDMENSPDDKTSYSTQYQEAILMYVENAYHTKHR